MVLVRSVGVFPKRPVIYPNDHVAHTSPDPGISLLSTLSGPLLFSDFHFRTWVDSERAFLRQRWVRLNPALATIKERLSSDRQNRKRIR